MTAGRTKPKTLRGQTPNRIGPAVNRAGARVVPTTAGGVYPKRDGARRSRPAPLIRAQRSILVFGSDPGTVGSLGVMLGSRGIVVDGANSITDALSLVTTQSPLLAIIDTASSSGFGVTLLNALMSFAGHVPVVVIATDERLVERLGACRPSLIYTVLPAPYTLYDLLRVVDVTAAASLGLHLDLPCTRPHTRSALEYLRQNYGGHFRARDLARAIGVSSSHLAHLFRAELKTSINDYVTTLRVEAAKYVLVRTDHKLESVAELVGFNDASHLSRQFKHNTGLRPGEYRIRKQLVTWNMS